MTRAAVLERHDRYSLEACAEEATSTAARRILLIEDNKSDVFLIKRMLRDAVPSEPFQVVDVPRIADALEWLSTAHADLILLDLNLLDMDGTASVVAIHASAPDIPIIVHSGANDPCLKHDALLHGARHYLVKGKESPFSFKFMIEKALARASL